MAKLYKESARMEDAINSIVKILHDEYEVPAVAGRADGKRVSTMVSKLF